MSQGKLRQRGSIAWLVLTFSQPTLVLFTVCNEASSHNASQCAHPISRVQRTQSTQRNLPELAASTSCRWKEQLSPHRWMGRDCHSPTRPQAPSPSHRFTFFRFFPFLANSLLRPYRLACHTSPSPRVSHPRRYRGPTGDRWTSTSTKVEHSRTWCQYTSPRSP